MFRFSDDDLAALSTSAVSAQTYDLALRGGYLIDPSTHRNGIVGSLGVAIANGRVVAVGASIS